jgi:hypothetical protein
LSIVHVILCDSKTLLSFIVVLHDLLKRARYLSDVSTKLLRIISIITSIIILRCCIYSCSGGCRSGCWSGCCSGSFVFANNIDCLCGWQES